MAAKAIGKIRGRLIISDEDLRELTAGDQTSIGHVDGDVIVYQEAWTAEQATSFVAAAVAPKPPT